SKKKQCASIDSDVEDSDSDANVEFADSSDFPDDEDYEQQTGHNEDEVDKLQPELELDSDGEPLATIAKKRQGSQAIPSRGYVNVDDFIWEKFTKTNSMQVKF